LLFNGLQKNLAAFILATFYASASLAAANDPGLPSDTAAQAALPANKPPSEIVAGINSECFSGYRTNFKIVTSAPEHKDMPVGSMKESLEETVAIALLRDGDKIMWCLAPSLGKISFNPIDDIKNLQVLLQYKYRF
jgi:hypothetical protein